MDECGIPEVKPPEEIRWDVKPVTAWEIVQLYPDKAIGVRLSIERLREICSEIDILFPAELFLAVCRVLEAYDQLGKLPQEVEIRRVDGPELRRENEGKVSASAESIVKGAVEAFRFMESRGRMPDSKVGSGELSPCFPLSRMSVDLQDERETR